MRNAMRQYNICNIKPKSKMIYQKEGRLHHQAHSKMISQKVRKTEICVIMVIMILKHNNYNDFGHAPNLE